MPTSRSSYARGHVDVATGSRFVGISPGGVEWWAHRSVDFEHLCTQLDELYRLCSARRRPASLVPQGAQR